MIDAIVTALLILMGGILIGYVCTLLYVQAVVRQHANE